MTPDDEVNILDRVMQHHADGFIGFYSTLPSSGLNNRIDALKPEIRILSFDKEKIESLLLRQKDYSLIRRYFPNSFRHIEYNEKINRPSEFLDHYYPLECAHCSKDLLLPENREMAIVVYVKKMNEEKVVDIITTCKGYCDEVLEHNLFEKGYLTYWEDISDLAIPTIYLRNIMGVLNRLHDDNEYYTPIAYDKLKRFLIAIAQYVYRDQSPEDSQRVKDLSQIPDYL